MASRWGNFLRTHTVSCPAAQRAALVRVFPLHSCTGKALLHPLDLIWGGQPLSLRLQPRQGPLPGGLPRRARPGPPPAPRCPAGPRAASSEKLFYERLEFRGGGVPRLLRWVQQRGRRRRRGQPRASVPSRGADWVLSGARADPRGDVAGLCGVARAPAQGFVAAADPH